MPWMTVSLSRRAVSGASGRDILPDEVPSSRPVR